MCFFKASSSVIVIDEIGKMEMFSRTFIDQVKSITSNTSITLLATIPIPKGKPIQMVEELRSHKNAYVFEVRQCFKS